MVEGSGLIDSENARFSLRFHVAIQNVFMQFYAISKQEIEQPVSPFDFFSYVSYESSWRSCSLQPQEILGPRPLLTAMENG